MPCSGVAAFATTRSSKVLLVSSISAQSSPGQSPSMRVGVPVRPSRPSASASRLAGSIVTTTARRPARAASSARTAAVVVLPTPPEPQHTRMRRSVHELAEQSGSPLAPGHTTSGSASTSAMSRSASCVELGRTDLGGEHVGQPDLGQGQLRRPAGRSAPPGGPCGRSGRRRRRPAPSPRRAAARCRAASAAARGSALEPRHLVVVAVDDDRPEAHADLVLEAEGGVDQLVHRRLLRKGHQHHPAARRGR